mgnify:CR=1 FL=1
MPSDSWNQLREQIIEKAVVRGKVVLSSGREADYYVDLRRVTLDAVAAPLVGTVMRELTEDDLTAQWPHELERPAVHGELLERAGTQTRTAISFQ